MATPRPFFDASLKIPKAPPPPEPKPETPKTPPDKRKDFGDLKMGAFFGILGFWVCEVCACQCLTLRATQGCECGHKLKAHVDNRCRQCHCTSFTPKLKSACPCGHGPHTSVFTRTFAEAKAPTPATARAHTARGPGPQGPQSRPSGPGRPFSARAPCAPCASGVPESARARPPESARSRLPRAHVPKAVPRAPRARRKKESSSDEDATPRWCPQTQDDSSSSPEVTPRPKDTARRHTAHGGSGQGSRAEQVRRSVQTRGPRKLEEIRARLDVRADPFEELPGKMRRAANAAMSARA